MDNKALGPGVEMTQYIPWSESPDSAMSLDSTWTGAEAKLDKARFAPRGKASGSSLRSTTSIPLVSSPVLYICDKYTNNKLEDCNKPFDRKGAPLALPL
jgi:hypothetical protein